LVVLSFSVTVLAASPACFSRDETRSQSGQRASASAAASASSHARWIPLKSNASGRETLAVQLFGAAEIEKGLVDRKRRAEWRQPPHLGARQHARRRGISPCLAGLRPHPRTPPAP
jgi:hypothetical protein